METLHRGIFSRPSIHQGEKNVVADALSRLDMDEKPSLQKALITEEMRSVWYCYAKEEMTFDSHPLSFQQLEKTQNADKSLIEILLQENSPYQKHSFPGRNNKGAYLQQH